MSYRVRRFRPDSAIATALVVAGVMAALMTELTQAPLALPTNDTLLALNLAPPPRPLVPPEKPHPRLVHARKPEGRAAPAGLRARPTDLVLPPPTLLPPPVLLVSAPTPGQGTASHVGNSAAAGPGPGAGGSGTGTGSGNARDGSGDGGDSAPIQRHGRLRTSDFPADAGEITRDWVVGVRYLVDIDGRVPRCEITRSSGLPVLDATTCSLIQKRFRFAPSRNAAGRPVPAWVVETHGWGPERGPDDTDQ